MSYGASSGIACSNETMNHGVDISYNLCKPEQNMSRFDCDSGSGFVGRHINHLAVSVFTCNFLGKICASIFFVKCVEFPVLQISANPFIEPLFEVVISFAYPDA